MYAVLIQPLVLAQAAPGASGNEGFFMLAQFALIGLIFWFFLIRPQQKQMKAHRAKIAAVKKGDSVVTGGGLVGKATKVDDTHIEIEIASGVKVKAIKATLSDVMPLGSGKAAND
jgi:preprotein translocase subunit YajC